MRYLLVIAHPNGEFKIMMCEDEMTGIVMGANFMTPWKGLWCLNPIDRNVFLLCRKMKDDLAKAMTERGYYGSK
jgi:hypothetical protein